MSYWHEHADAPAGPRAVGDQFSSEQSRQERAVRSYVCAATRALVAFGVVSHFGRGPTCWRLRAGGARQRAFPRSEANESERALTPVARW
jgi:hypothetical protein